MEETYWFSRWFSKRTAARRRPYFSNSSKGLLVLTHFVPFLCPLSKFYFVLIDVRPQTKIQLQEFILKKFCFMMRWQRHKATSHKRVMILGNLRPILTCSDFSSKKLNSRLAASQRLGCMLEITEDNYISNVARDGYFLKKARKNDYPWGCLANAEQDYTITQTKK